MNTATRIEYLEQLCKEVGLGQTRTRGNMADFYVTDRADVLQLLEVVGPFLRMKREQSEKFTEICKKLDEAENDPGTFLEACYLVDEVSRLNDSRRGTRVNTADAVKAYFIENGFIKR